MDRLSGFFRQKCVDAALHLVKSCPAPAPLVVSISSSRGAWPAANGPITLVVQGIVGDGLLANVLPYGFAFPVCHRVQLYDVAPGRLIELVDLNDPDIRPGFRLLPAQSPDPAIPFAQLILQRKDLSHRAAKVRIALPELR